MTLPPFDPDVLQHDVRSRFIDGVNGLRMHLLEAGDPAAPCVVLLHGFPEIAYSWRKILPKLAAAGYYAVAPDLRGYGRTATGATAFQEDLAPYRMTNRLLRAQPAVGTRAPAGRPGRARLRFMDRRLLRLGPARCVRLAHPNERAFRRRPLARRHASLAPPAH